MRFKLQQCAGIIVFALSTASCITAQTDSDEVTPYTPMTLGEKYKFSFHRVFGPSALFAAGLRATFDQADTKPHDWGTSSDAFGVRLASHFGRVLIHQNLAFGVRALDHEDPRYFISGKGSKISRTRYAVVHTFVVHKDDSGWMPAYSRFVGDFGTPFITQRWLPGRLQSVHDGIRAGTVALSVSAVMNVGREFWPDIRKRVLATQFGQRHSEFLSRF